MEVQIIILAIAGFVAGFIGSEVGSGALITLPILLFMGLPPALAIGTNILSAWIINVVAALDYCCKKKIRYDIIVHLAPVALAGSLFGSYAIAELDPVTANQVVTFLFVAIFIFLLTTLRNPTFGLKGNHKEFSLTKKILAVPLVFLLGVYGGFFTVAITTLVVMFLITFLKQNFMQATGEAVFITAILLFGSLMMFISKDLVNYQLAIPLAITSGLGAHFGAKVALTFGSRWLRGMTMGIVFLIIGKLAFDSYQMGCILIYCA